MRSRSTRGDTTRGEAAGLLRSDLCGREPADGRAAETEVRTRDKVGHSASCRGEEAATKTAFPLEAAGELADESKNLALIRIERKLEEFEKLLARKFGRAQREGV